MFLYQFPCWYAIYIIYRTELDDIYVTYVIYRSSFMRVCKSCGFEKHTGQNAHHNRNKRRIYICSDDCAENKHPVSQGNVKMSSKKFEMQKRA